MKKHGRHTQKRLTAWLIALCTLLSAVGPRPVQAAADEATQSYGYNGYDVIYDITGKWEEKRQIQITIHNTGDEPIRNWCLKYNEQGTITELWNAVMTDHADGMIVMKNAGHNTDIPAKDSVSFGYTLDSAADDYPECFVLTQDRHIVAHGYEVCHTITNDWGDGLQGTISITNLTDKTMEGWQLSFTSDLSIDDLWGAAVSREENRYTLAAHPWASSISAGDTITIGFIGTKNETGKELFSDYVLTEIVAFPNEAGSPEDVSEESTEGESEGTTEGESETALENESERNTEDSTQADHMADSDDDGLPDILEAEYGCDSHNPDSDGDGLPDGYEVFHTFTNPSKTDTDGNMIPDDEADPDRDGLTNLEEYHAGTNPWNSDSDGDDVSDYDELHIHQSNPLDKDSDKDGLSDGDELLLGYDPNNPDTNGNGIGDAMERKWQQLEVTVHGKEEHPINKAAVSMDCSGCISSNTVIENMWKKDVVSSNVAGLLGSPVSITSDASFDEAVITFYYDKSLLGNHKEEDITIMWYDEENQQYVLFDDDTQRDFENNKVSYRTTHFSTYLVVDKDEWYEAWRRAPEYPEAEGPGLDLFCVVGTLPIRQNDNHAMAKTIVEGLKGQLSLGGKMTDRIGVTCYPFDNSPVLAGSVSGAITQANRLACRDIEGAERLYLCQDGIVNTDYFYPGLSWDNYNRVYCGNFTGLGTVHNTGKMLASTEKNATFFHYDENGYITRSYCNLFTTNYTYMQLAEHLYGAEKLCGTVNVLEQAGIGFDYAGLGGLLVSEQGEVLQHCIERMFPTEWSQLSTDVSDMPYLNYISLFGCDGSTAIKDIWLEGSICTTDQNLIRQGIRQALETFEEEPEASNERRIMLLCESDIHLAPEDIQKAVELEVSISVVFIGNGDENSLAGLAAAARDTGGEFYTAMDADAIMEILHTESSRRDRVNMTDTDEDGIPDVYEICGMAIRDGSIRYSDPFLKDSDGDGILDGEEMGIGSGQNLRASMKSQPYKDETGEIKLRAFFSCSSFPDMIDSDEDGYLDGIPDELEDRDRYADEADKTPLLSSVRVTMLSGAEEGKYVPVVYGGEEYPGYLGYSTDTANPNYGGNQSWMYDKSAEVPNATTEKEAYLEYIANLSVEDYHAFAREKGGCGITALTDFCMYLECYNDDFDTWQDISLQEDEHGNQYIDYDDYVKIYLDTEYESGFGLTDRLLEERYDITGVHELDLLLCLNAPGMIHRKNNEKFQLFKFSSLFSDTNIIDRITTQLENNIPVILAVSTDKVEIRLIAYKNDTFVGKIIPEKEDTINDDTKSENMGLHHYMTITGYVQDFQTNKDYFILSTWGEKTLLDVNDLREIEKNASHSLKDMDKTVMNYMKDIIDETIEKTCTGVFLYY